MEFQITQNYGESCRGYLYFEVLGVVPSIDSLELLAIKKVQDEWKNKNPALYITSPRPCRPTIEVNEYQNGKRVKGGISFKCKWR